MTETNVAVRLAKRPVGLPDKSAWDIKKEPVGTPGDGQVLVKIAYISLDPAMRGWINEGKSYIDPVGVGDVMRAGAVGEVLASNAEGFAPGDHVVGAMGVQKFAIADAKSLTKIDPDLAPLQRYLGALGMPGMTAYFGILEVGALKDGETVVVSGATGAVGSVVGQIAKLRGCTVIGIAGGPDKCKMAVEDYGFDHCIDYKNQKVAKQLRKAAPEGVDVYFDNVGGEILDAVLQNIRLHARIVICGAISQYNNMQKVDGPSNYLNLLVNRAKMEGFVVFDYARRYDVAMRDIAEWIGSGRMTVKEDIQEGIENFPTVFQMLFKGENTAKLVLKP